MSLLAGGGRVFGGYDGATDASELSEMIDLNSNGQHLDVHYQPILSAQNGHIVGVEALLRRVHPDFGSSSAETLVRAAERTGQIRRIGRWVIDRVLAQMRSWAAMHEGPGLVVSMNLSPIELADEPFVMALLETVSDSGIESDRLNIELTESAASIDIERLRSGLSRLRESKVRVSLDDFGAGMSALAYLHELPLDAIKIDRSFVAGFGGDNRAEQVVAHICELAAALSLQTVAEGIETRSQWERVIASGCDQGQGYYLSPPVPAEAIEEILRSHSEWSVSSRAQGTLWAS